MTAFQRPDSFTFGAQEIMREIRDTEVDYILEESEKNRPTEDDFKKVYGEEEVERDKETVQRLKEKFRDNLERGDITRDEHKRIESGKRRSEALEATIVQLADFGWFGSNSYMTRTTEYDDIENGIDAVLEIEQDDGGAAEPQRIALAVDASTDSRIEVVRGKIDRNLKKILGTYKKPPEVKYFQSQVEEDEEGNPAKKKLEHIVPVVIGLESTHANELMSLYVRMLKLKANPNTSKDPKGDLKALKQKILKHPAQVIFLQEMNAQLELYRTVLEEKPTSTTTDLLDQIKNLQETIRDITFDKAKIDSSTMEKDAVYTEIRATCNKFTSEALGK